MKIISSHPQLRFQRNKATYDAHILFYLDTIAHKKDAARNKWEGTNNARQISHSVLSQFQSSWAESDPGVMAVHAPHKDLQH